MTNKIDIDETLDKVLGQEQFTKDDLIYLMSLKKQEDLEKLYKRAYQIKEKYIGIQIKPVNQGIQLAEIFKEKTLQLKTHETFEKEFGGKVFYIYSSKENGKKVIMNPEVIDEIRHEIIQLEK